MLTGMDQITPPQPPDVDPEAAARPVPLEECITVADICDRLGRRAIAETIGVGATAVSNASAEGLFSPAWFVGIKTMCDKAGLPCPERLFKWKIARPEDRAEQDTAVETRP